MSVIIVVGAQWGDEGKAKIVDIFSERADIIARWGGGANAGHTVVVGDKKIIFHLIPAGILWPGKICCLGNGMVIDPWVLNQDIEDIGQLDIDHEREDISVSTDGRIVVSPRAHVTLPCYKTWEESIEQRKGKSKIGTTARAIGMTYAAKALRIGLTMGVFMNDKRFADWLPGIMTEMEVYGVPANINETLQQCRLIREKLSEKIILKDISNLINGALQKDKMVLAEGAQGTMLDLDHGTYPYVTSSNPTAGGACVGLGIGPTQIDEVIGIIKAYTTRVGQGPFTTELTNNVGDSLQCNGQEVGSTTGRKRRCGWLDLVALRHAAKINKFTSLVVTKLDVLTGHKPKICVAYKIDGNKIADFPDDIEELKRCQPVYEELAGWTEDISGTKTFEDLPLAARSYVQTIKKELGISIEIVSVGAERSQTIRV